MSWSARLLLGILLWFLAGFLGFYESYRLKLRVSQLEQLQSVLKLLETEIRFARIPINTFLERFKDSHSIIKSCYARYQNNLDFSSAWTEMINQISVLNKEEKNVFCEFGKSFGTTDHFGQLDSCNLMQSHITRMQEEARSNLQKKGTLYRSLGFLCGAGIVLILM